MAKSQPFEDLASSRLPVLMGYDADHQHMLACDNRRCGNIDAKSPFRRWSGCQSLYYCSAPCQRMDWREGTHRAACDQFRSIRHRSADPSAAASCPSCAPCFTRTTSRTGTRFFASNSRTSCAGRRPTSTRSSGTDGKVDIDVHTIGEYPATYDWSVDWVYCARRKSESGGQMELHLMVTAQEDATAAAIFPLRRRDSRVSEGLKRMALMPQTAVQEELSAIYEPLLLSLIAEDDGSIHQLRPSDLTLRISTTETCCSRYTQSSEDS
ncbi:hypothetical protein FB451DRAFT_1266006 [Mycena latifolia]|nr:hypothetical protein FB451DRAFT_1266006 [Mycena latifolia]